MEGLNGVMSNVFANRMKSVSKTMFPVAICSRRPTSVDDNIGALTRASSDESDPADSNAALANSYLFAACVAMGVVWVVVLSTRRVK